MHNLHRISQKGKNQAMIAGGSKTLIKMELV